MKTYQVTVFNSENKYKPISTLVKTAEDNVTASTLLEIKKEGLKKICIKMKWNGTQDMKRYGFDKVKMREYDKEKIERENKEKYEKIKQEKYACGEWKCPNPKKKTLDKN